MAMSRRSAERGDDLAGDRDDTAEHRDTTAADRDDAAEQRDTTAAERDEDTGRELATLDDRLRTIRQQIDNHPTPVESSTDPATGNLTRLVDELRSALQHLQDDRADTAADRGAAAGDRRQSARDRDGSAQDRASAAQDRDQATIERAQDGSPQPTWTQNLPPRHEHPVSHAPQALSESRRRITASSEQLSRTSPTGHTRDEGG